MTTKLRESLKNGMVVAPGCFDAFTARLAQKAGFEAIHMTGFGVEATQLGAPDLGLMSMSEIVNHAGRMAAAIDIPIIADIDTGFGGVLNVQRTISEIERAGVAGVHIEDQSLPKHCPLLAGRTTVSRADAIDRVKAAVDARTDPNFLISARCDADTISVDELIERCNLYLEAGADMVMPITMAIDGKSFFSLPPEEQMAVSARVNKAINGPIMGMGSGPPAGYTVKDMEEAGFSILMYAATALGVMGNAVSALFKAMKEDGTDAQFIAANPGPYHDPLTMLKAVRLDDYVEVERKFTSSL
ncbi:MAG: oxaloacetate decarboxylase [Sphingomonadaceae bacterium]